MSYINRHLLQNEQVLMTASKHWIVFLPTIIWLIFTYFIHRIHPFRYADLIPMVITLVIFILNAIDYFFSEYAITNQRLLMKEGFVWRKSIEIILSSIARSELQQSLSGRLLGYGQIIVFGFGGSNSYSNIASPNKFNQRLQQSVGD